MFNSQFAVSAIVFIFVKIKKYKKYKSIASLKTENKQYLNTYGCT